MNQCMEPGISFFYLTYNLYGKCVKIFIINYWYISKSSYTTTIRIQLTDNRAGPAVVSTITSMGREHSQDFEE